MPINSEPGFCFIHVPHFAALLQLIPRVGANISNPTAANGRRQTLAWYTTPLKPSIIFFVVFAAHCRMLIHKVAYYLLIAGLPKFCARFLMHNLQRQMTFSACLQGEG